MESRGQAGNSHVVYESTYFTQYQPRHALDIVQQTPGFTLNEGESQRGLSGAVANLLIDGLRPSTKSQSISDILTRIPASQVLRVELLRGAAVAGDPSGAAMLLNIVRRPGSGAGIWSLGVEYGATHELAPRGQIAYNGRLNAIEYGVSAMAKTQYRQDDAYRIGSDARHLPRYRTETPEDRRTVDWALSGDAAMPLWGGRLTSTAQLALTDYRADREFLTTDFTGTLASRRTTNSWEDKQKGEVGLHFDRTFDRWDMSLLGIFGGENTDTSDHTLQRDNSNILLGNTLQVRERKSSESIIRATVATLIDNHQVEFGIEGALNTLEQAFAMTEEAGAGRLPVRVPNANIRVEEERADLFGSYVWTPTPDWSLETRLAWETSRLEFTGDSAQAVDLSFWKPAVHITRALRDSNQLRVRVYRDVGQLDFGSFVSAVSVAENRIDGGNPGLRPTTSWRAEVGADLRFDNNAALSLTLSHHWLEDVEDQVLIVAPGPMPGDPPIRFGARGNIGKGKRSQLDASLLQPLDFVLTGAQVVVKTTFSKTDVTDPIDGRRRGISDVSHNAINIAFRHDMPGRPYSWGVTWEMGSRSRNFRYDEINSSTTDPWITAFAETTALPNDMRLRVLVEDIGSRATTNRLRFYEPDRAGDLSGHEWRHLQRTSSPWVLIEISKQI